MKIVIAPDSYKESLTSIEVAAAIERGLRRVYPRARCIKVPMADGGEGTVQALVAATGGRVLRRRVTGPLGERVQARFGLLGDGRTAVIEMAEASGLPLVPREQRNPMLTTTRGTGELITAALDLGVEEIIVGIGGSATTDGGTGMAQALGVRFRAADGTELTAAGCGALLADIASIDLDGLDPRLSTTRITVACDVDNPLCGRRGAARVFGPQKGATAEMVALLDEGLSRFARIVRRDLGRDVARRPGAGAAGGLGSGLMAFTDAQLRSGIDIVVEAAGLARHLRGAALVVTGEGRVDAQTPFGKTPAGVARAARRLRVPVVALGGGLADDARTVFDHGIDALEAAVARDMDLATALRDAERYIENAAERAARLIRLGERLARVRVRRGGAVSGARS